MKVKICGVTRAEDAELACELGAWAVGLVFAPVSPRRLTLEAARKLRHAVMKGTLAVGVFQDVSRDDIEAVILECRLDAIQLHGPQSPKDCRGFSIPVIKAFGLSGKTTPDLEAYDVFAALLEPARSVSDRQAGRKPGADAQREAWETAAKLKGNGPMIILAGGLDVESVGEAVRVGRPDAVDVSGGVESAPGIKDAKKLRGFFKTLAIF